MCSRLCVLSALVLILALATRGRQSQGVGAYEAEAGHQFSETVTASSKTSRDDSTPHPPSTAPNAAAGSTAQTKPTLADFAWLAGRWQGAWGPRIAQQVWMPPKGDVMLGTFQLVDNGQTLVIELYTIVQKASEIDLYLRHFTPALAPWETSTPALLKLASSTPRAIEFDNPVNGQPRRAVFRRIDADTYVSHTEIVPEKGNPQVVEIVYHRQKDALVTKH